MDEQQQQQQQTRPAEDNVEPMHLDDSSSNVEPSELTVTAIDGAAAELGRMTMSDAVFRFEVDPVAKLSILRTIDIALGDACWMHWRVLDAHTGKLVSRESSWFVKDAGGDFVSTAVGSIGDCHLVRIGDAIKTCKCTASDCNRTYLSMQLLPSWFEKNVGETATTRVYSPIHPMLVAKDTCLERIARIMGE